MSSDAFSTGPRAAAFNAAGRIPTKVTLEPQDICVEQHIYLKWVRSQLESEVACLQLPFTIILLFSFIGVALLHLRQDLVYSVEQAIAFDIDQNANFAFELNFGNKGLRDIHSFADIWSWARLGFFPLVIQPTWSSSERYTQDAGTFFPGAVGADPNPHWNFQAFGPNSKPIPVTGDYLHYNRIIGGVRFQQQVAPFNAEACKFPSTGMGVSDVWKKWYGKACSPAWQEFPFTPDSLDSEEFHHPERVEWFLLGGLMTIGDMLQKVVDMEDGCSQLEAKNRTGNCLCLWCAAQNPPRPWVGEDTQRVQISFPTYNAEYGLMTMTGVNMFISRGMRIQTRIEMQSLWMDPFAVSWGELIKMLVCDFIWLAMLVYVLVTEIQDIVHALKVGEGPHWYNTLWDDYISLWNMVDWVTIIIGGVVVTFFGLMMAGNLRMHEHFKVLLEAEVGPEPLSMEGHLPRVEAFYESLEEVLVIEKYFRTTLCMYPMMVMMRLFKSFAAQARLAVVTDTMVFAYQDLIHFFIVFFGVFFCLTLSSVLFFGQDLEEFGTIFRATNTCFRMMFGDWDWDSLDKVRRTVAMVWFSAVMLLMVLILLNMLLAIIMDNYMKVKQKISDPSLAPSLMKQIQEMVRRRQQYKAGKRVRLNDIYATFLARHDGNEKAMLRSSMGITPTFLLNTVPNIETNQATRTLTNAKEDHRKANEKDFELSDLRAESQDDDGVEQISTLQRLDDATRRVRDALLYVQDRVTFYDTVVTDMGAQSKDASGLLARAASASASAAAESAVSDEVLEYVGTEVARLNYETATVLGQTLRRVDIRQRHIETRQDDMVTSIREMHQTLLNLQSDSQSLSNKLRRLNHDQDKVATTSAWGGFARGGVPALFSNCSPDAQEGGAPGLRESRGKMPT